MPANIANHIHFLNFIKDFKTIMLIVWNAKMTSFSLRISNLIKTTRNYKKIPKILQFFIKREN